MISPSLVEMNNRLWATAIPSNTAALPGNSRAVRKLGRIIRRCLAEDPADRYPSVTELRKALIPAIKACPALEMPGTPRIHVPDEDKRNNVPEGGGRSS